MLKFTFLLILLANLVFLLWEHQQGAFSKKRPSVAENQRDHAILLIAEAPPHLPRKSAHSAAITNHNAPLKTGTNQPEASQTITAPTTTTPEPLPQKIQNNPAAIDSSLTDKTPTPPQQPGDPDKPAAASQQTEDASNQKPHQETPPAEAEPTLADAPRQPETACFEQQLFKTEQAAKDWLSQQSIAGDIREIEKSIPASYLVYIPAAKNARMARQTVQELTQKGVKDFWLFRKGPMKNAVSLGLFVKQHRAEKLASQLQKKGIAVKTEVRFKPVKQWLVTPAASSASDCLTPALDKMSIPSQ